MSWLRHLIVTALFVSGASFGCNDRGPDRVTDTDKKAPLATTSATGSITAKPPPAAASASADPSATGSAPTRPDELVLVAGGDVNLGREAGQAILKDPNYDPFVNLAPLFESGDLRFVNLESQLSDQDGETQSPLNRLIFTGPPGGAKVLARAHIDVVSVANNHAWDYRKSGFLQTLENLSQAGVGFVGGSAEPMQQYKPYIFKAKGWSVAIFAVTQIWNQGPFDKHPGQQHVAWARFDLLHRNIQKAKRENDLVILSYHGGGEYIDVPMLMTRDFIKVVMKAGVDVVIGHHPHVVHGVRWFEGRPAFFSLGNLVFNQHIKYPWTGTGFLARLTFRRGAPPKVEACPYHILGHTPQLFEGEAKEPLERAFRQHLKLVSITVGGTEVGEPGDYSCMELGPPQKKRPRP